MVWRCRKCGHQLKEFRRNTEEINSKPQRLDENIEVSSNEEKPLAITAIRIGAQNILNSILTNPKEESANWTYTALPDKVYVRGSKGFLLWRKLTSLTDTRKVIILELD